MDPVRSGLGGETLLSTSPPGEVLALLHNGPGVGQPAEHVLEFQQLPLVDGLEFGVASGDEGDLLQPGEAPEELVGGHPDGAARGVEGFDVAIELVPPLLESVELLVAEGPPGLQVLVEGSAQLGHHLPLVGLVAVELEAVVVEVPGLEAAVDHLEGGHLLADEEDALAVGYELGDHVGDGLALPRAGGAVHHEALACEGVLDAELLAAVGV